MIREGIGPITGSIVGLQRGRRGQNDGGAVLGNQTHPCPNQALAVATSTVVTN
jgi:hypothetical protein